MMSHSAGNNVEHSDMSELSEDDSHPIMEIREELDEDGNVISSSVAPTTGKDALSTIQSDEIQQLLEKIALERASKSQKNQETDAGTAKSGSVSELTEEEIKNWQSEDKKPGMVDPKSDAKDDAKNGADNSSPNYSENDMRHGKNAIDEPINESSHSPEQSEKSTESPIKGILRTNSQTSVTPVDRKKSVSFSNELNISEISEEELSDTQADNTNNDLRSIVSSLPNPVRSMFDFVHKDYFDDEDFDDGDFDGDFGEMPDSDEDDYEYEDEYGRTRGRLFPVELSQEAYERMMAKALKEFMAIPPDKPSDEPEKPYISKFQAERMKRAASQSDTVVADISERTPGARGPVSSIVERAPPVSEGPVSSTIIERSPPVSEGPVSSSIIERAAPVSDSPVSSKIVERTAPSSENTASSNVIERNPPETQTSVSSQIPESLASKSKRTDIKAQPLNIGKSSAPTKDEIELIKARIAQKPDDDKYSDEIMQKAAKYFQDSSITEEQFLQAHDNPSYADDDIDQQTEQLQTTKNQNLALNIQTLASSSRPVSSSIISDIIEKETSMDNAEDLDDTDAPDMSEIARDYQIMRQKLVNRTGGFKQTDAEKETEPLEPTKMSRFKAARLSNRMA